MEDFKTWININNLIEFSVNGLSFTCYNGRNGSALMERKLDRVLCNNYWFDYCHSMKATIQTRWRSDHHPILVEASFSQSRLVSQF